MISTIAVMTSRSYSEELRESKIVQGGDNREWRLQGCRGYEVFVLRYAKSIPS